MSLGILGTGTSVPDCSVSQGQSAALASEISGLAGEAEDRLSVLYGLTGITRRHVAILDQGVVVPVEVSASAAGPTTRWRMERYEKHVGSIAVSASRSALAEAQVAPGAITHLVTVSCTGFAAPGFDLQLVKELGLVPTVERTHVGFMGCHGALNGLRISRAIAASEPGARVLLCAAELCSLHFSYGSEEDRSVPNALFADGAAALVAAPGTETDDSVWKVVANGSVLVPGTEEAMTWKIGDHGFVMTLSPEIPALIQTHLAPWLAGWVQRQGFDLEDIRSWCVHPGGPRILDAVRRSLGLEKAAMDDSRAILAGYGNMSSPTILFILKRLIARDAPRPCIALGFGPGLAIEAALFV